MKAVMMKNKAGTQAGPVLLHHSRHQGSNVRGCERMEEVKKERTKVEASQKRRGEQRHLCGTSKTSLGQKK